MKQIQLDRPMLFVELFARCVEFVGRDRAKDTPPKTLFHRGASLANEIRFLEERSGEWKDSFERVSGFKDGKPVRKKGTEGRLNIPPNTRIIYQVGVEYFDMDASCWYRSKDQLVAQKPKRDVFLPHMFLEEPTLPYKFSISNVDKQGLATCGFPRGHAPLEVGVTYRYLCHKEQYQLEGMKYVFPNTYLVLFVKNYGLLRQIDVLDEEQFAEIDPAHLCLSDEIKERDYRKSKDRFTF